MDKLLLWCFLQNWWSTYGPDAKYRNQWLQWLTASHLHIFSPSCIGTVCHFVASLCHGLNWVGFGEAEISVLPMLQRPSTSGPEGPWVEDHPWWFKDVQGKISSFHDKSNRVRTELNRIERNGHRKWKSKILNGIERYQKVKVLDQRSVFSSMLYFVS